MERFDALSGPQIWLMRHDGSQPRWFADGATPSWSSDGTRVVFVAPGNRIVIAGLDGTREVLPIANAPTGYLWSPALSPDGATVAFAAGDGLYVVGSAGGTATRLVTDYLPAPAWSPDGAWIAFVERGGAVALVRPDGSGFHEVPEARAVPGSRLAWSPDGAEIVYGDNSNGALAGGLSITRLDGSPPTQLVPWLGGNQLRDPAWSPDGTRIAFSDSDVCVANADGTQVGRLTYTPTTDIGDITGHPAWQPLPAESAPAGPPETSDGPVSSWNRNNSWYPACGLIWQGLAVTASGPSRVTAHKRASLALTVTNRSNTPLGTDGLVAVDAQLHGAVFLRARTSQGRCDAHLKQFVTCELGALWPNESAHVKLDVRAGRPGNLVLTCSLPRPASDANEPSAPDCERRVTIWPK